MHEKMESGVHTDKVFDQKAEEERMDNALADEIYELERCIECGCCSYSCPATIPLVQAIRYGKAAIIAKKRNA